MLTHYKRVCHTSQPGAIMHALMIRVVCTKSGVIQLTVVETVKEIVDCYMRVWHWHTTVFTIFDDIP